MIYKNYWKTAKSNAIAAHGKTNYWPWAFTDLKYLDNNSNINSAKKIDTDFRSVITDQNRRSRFEQKELENLILKSILISEHQGKLIRKTPSNLGLGALELDRSIFRKLRKRRGTITRVRNRCVLSGRSSIVHTTGFSRIVFRRLAGFGKIPGLLKI